MPNEFEFIEPDLVKCVKIKVPVVIAETEDAQIVVDNTFCLPELAKKIDHIDISVRDLEADPVFVHHSESTWNISMSKKWPHHHSWGVPSGKAFLKKVIVHGVLHKQIFYVNKDDQVKHVAEDVPFSKTIDFAEPEPVIDIDDVEIQFRGKRADITWDLIRASRLQQTGIVIIRVKAVEQRQIWVQVCPSPDKKCKKDVNVLRDPCFEQWVGNAPLLWGATNVFRTDGRNGHGAGLGRDPRYPAAVFQTTSKVVSDLRYQLCFWAKKIQEFQDRHHEKCDFTVEAQVSFFNGEGEIIDSQSQSWSHQQIPTNFKQFCFTTGRVPEDTSYALVRIAMHVPSTGDDNNRCQVIIDDVTLKCTGGF